MLGRDESLVWFCLRHLTEVTVLVPACRLVGCKSAGDSKERGMLVYLISACYLRVYMC